MTKVKRSALSILMAIVITIQTAVSGFAMPAIPVVYGVLALFSAVAITLGYQTTQIHDFSALYSKLSKDDKNLLREMNSSGATIALATGIVDMVHDVIYGEVGYNKVVERYNGYNQYKPSVDDPNKSQMKVSTQPVQDQVLNSTPKAIDGYTSIYELCDTFDSETAYNKFYVSQPLKLQDKYYRYKLALSKSVETNAYYSIESSTDQQQWQMISLPVMTIYGFSWSTIMNLDTRYNFFTKLYIDPASYKLGLSYHWFDSRSQAMYWRQTSQIIDTKVFNDATVVENASIKSKVQKLDVDKNKLKGTSYNTTKTYTANDLIYSDADIKPSTLTAIDPIIKTSSSGSGTGSNTGGTTTIDLSGVISGLNDLKIQTNAQSTQQYDFFSWIKTMLTNMYNAILNIPIAIVTAIQAVITAVQATTTAISALGTTIGTNIANALSGLFTSLITAVQGIASSILSGLASLFVPDFANLQSKFNNLNNKFKDKLGLFWQASEGLQSLFKQDYNYKEPEITIKLDPPYGDGGTYKVIDFAIFSEYRTQYLIIVNAMVWFVFFRNLAVSNPLRGGSKS